jgi:DNA polymerase-3 subunit delta'
MNMAAHADLSAQPSGWPILGHDRPVSMLRRSLREKRLVHAYLFTGPEGVGKRTLALAFAMSLNCQAEPAAGQSAPDVPCGLCASCSRISRGTHPDVVEVNLETQAQMLADTPGKGKSGPAKELKIDIIRDMQSTVGLHPYMGRRRVYIIGDADRLNEEASNCMLKTLEEPPSHTILVLLAPNEDAVLPTISSRCLHVALRPLQRRMLADSLVRLWGAEEEQAETAAALSGGRPGYALALTEEPERMARRKAALEELALLSGMPPSDRINKANTLAKMFTDARADLYDLLDVWEGWWRDVLIVRASASELAVNVDQLPALASVAGRVSASRASGAIELIQAARRQLFENVNPRLALEALTLGLP